MSKKSLPENIGFLPEAYREYQKLETRDAAAFGIVHESLALLGKAGPAKDTRPFHSDEPGFPRGLAYWFPAGEYIVVFEPQSRMVLKSSAGSQTVRSVLIGGKDKLYTIWMIISNRS